MKNTDKKQTSYLPWLIWSVCSAFYFYIYVVQTSPSVFALDLMRDFKIDAVGIGNIGAYFFYPYMLLQVLIGILLDRFGARVMMTLSIAICSIGSIVCGFAPIFFIFELGRFLMGLGSAIATAGSMMLIASWFAPRRFAVLVGLLTAIGMLGGMAGSGGLAIIISYFSWRTSSFMIGILGFLIAILAWIIIRDQSGKGQDGIDDLVLQKPSLKVGLSRVILKKQNWICGGYAGLMYFPVIIMGMIWGVPFLISAYQMSEHMAALLVSIIFFGFMFGGPFFGWIFERFHGSRRVLFVPAFGLFIMSLIMIYVPGLSRLSLLLVFFLFGFFSSAELLGFTFVKNCNPSRYIGTSLGFANLLGTVGGALFPPLVGFLLVLGWEGKTVSGAHFYLPSTFHMALSVVPLISLSAFILVFFIAPFSSAE